MIRFSSSSREDFERLKQTDPMVLTDLERAMRFLYLQLLAFGGKVNSPTFGVRAGQSARFSYSRLQENLQAIAQRLESVTIENLDYTDCIKRYDGNKVLFYLDPPYWGTEDCYGKELFSRGEYIKMAEMLRQSKGAWIMSINDVPEIRELFAEFHYKQVDVTYALRRDRPAKAQELIISNHPLR